MGNLFAKNLAYLRKANSKTQDDIGFQVSKRNTTVSNWENGLSDPSLEELVTLSTYFEVPVDDLLKVDLSIANLTAKTEGGKKQQKANLKANPLANLNEPKQPYRHTKKAAETLSRSLAQLQQLQEQQQTTQQAINTHITGILTTLAGGLSDG